MAKSKKKAEKVNINEVLDNIDKAEIKEESEKVNQQIDEFNKKVEDQLDKKVEEVEKKIEKLEDEIGKANGNPVHQKQGFIRTVSLRSPIPMYQLPEDIQQYLKNMCFGTNVYLMDKEWLEKHNADMEMINKLKQYISEHFN